MRWCTEQFGPDVLHRDVILPTAGFLPPVYEPTRQHVESVVRQLCELMLVDPEAVKLELTGGSSARAQRPKLGRRAVGHYRQEHGRALISLDLDEAADPMVLTAIAVHELCHVKLLGEGRINAQRSDQERLTDLLTVYFGFGIFSTNAALRFARADRAWSILPHGEYDDITLNAARMNDMYSRLGYLRSPEFAYAIACYCWLRRETDPAWVSALSAGPQAFLRQGLAYLKQAAPVGELPTQRLVNKSVRLGNTTIRVMPAQASRIGSLGIVLPQQPRNQAGSDAEPPQPGRPLNG
jgi:hypothetical protein